MKPTLLVLAAGMGSRYGGLKQVDALGPNGEAIIDFSVYDALRAGFGKVVFVIRESIEEAFRAKFSNSFEDKIAVDYVYQEVNTPIEGLTDIPHREKPWGTAHAVLVAENAIKEPFAVINADDYYGVAPFKNMADFLTGPCGPTHYSMIGYQLTKTLSDHGSVSRGVAAMDEHQLMTEVTERHKIRRMEDGIIYFDSESDNRTPLPENSLVSMNFWGFHPNIFPIIREQFIDFVKETSGNPKAEFYIPLVINQLVQDNRIKCAVLPSDEQWYGVTYQEDKPIVQDFFQRLTAEGIYPAPVWG